MAALRFVCAAVALDCGDVQAAPRSTLVTAHDENPAEIVAAKIRNQGYYCDGPISAEKDKGHSSPNEPVWVLKCWNAIYRVLLIPDMAARIEHLN